MDYLNANQDGERGCYSDKYALLGGIGNPAVPKKKKKTEIKRKTPRTAVSTVLGLMINIK